jgi:hypothetical protein
LGETIECLAIGQNSDWQLGETPSGKSATGNWAKQHLAIENGGCNWSTSCALIVGAPVTTFKDKWSSLAIGRNSEWQLSIWQLGETAIGNWAKQRLAIEHLALGQNSAWQLGETASGK